MCQTGNTTVTSCQVYSLGQQPDAEHLSVLRRECHGPDVAHRLLDGTWLRSASHNRQSAASSQRPAPHSCLRRAGVATMLCDWLLLQHAKLVVVFIYLNYPTYIKGVILKRHNANCLIKAEQVSEPINASPHLWWSDLPWTRNSPSLLLGLWGYAREKASTFVTGGSRPRRLRVRGFVRPPAAWRRPPPPPRFLRGGESQRPDSLAPPRRSAEAWCNERYLRSFPTICAKC